MSDIARDFFANNPAMGGPVLAIVIFTLVFAVAAFRALTADKAHVDRMSMLALEGEDDHE